MKRGRALHSAILPYRDGRPPCGHHGNLMRTIDLNSITCGNCQGQLLTAMAKGIVEADFERWYRAWHPHSIEDAEEVRSLRTTWTMNVNIDLPRGVR